MTVGQGLRLGSLMHTCMEEIAMPRGCVDPPRVCLSMHAVFQAAPPVEIALA